MREARWVFADTFLTLPRKCLSWSDLDRPGKLVAYREPTSQGISGWVEGRREDYTLSKREHGKHFRIREPLAVAGQPDICR